MSIDLSQYVVWCNDEQFGRKFVSPKPVLNGWAPEFEYVEATGVLRPVAALSDEEWAKLPHVFSRSHDVAWYRARGWDRGASVIVPFDDPRYQNGGFQPDALPRWEVKPNPENPEHDPDPLPSKPLSPIELLCYQAVKAAEFGNEAVVAQDLLRRVTQLVNAS